MRRYGRLSVALIIAVIALVPLAIGTTTDLMGGSNIHVDDSDSLMGVTTMADSALIATGQIQTAIDNANPGDTIYLWPKTYYDNVEVDRDLKIKGWGKLWTIVDGQKLGPVFTIDGGVTATLSGITIRNGLANFGGGIDNKGTLNLNNVLITGNKADYGGGVYNDGGELNMYAGSSIRGNWAGISGGGIVNSGDSGVGPAYGTVNMYASSSVIYNHADSSINGNDADNYGGGIANWLGTVNMYKGSSIANNEADYGGGISNYYDPSYLPGGTVIMNGGSISGNTAWNGAGILNVGTVEMNWGSYIAGNEASYVGGGIFNAGDVVMNKGSSITHNIASEGAGVYWVLGSTLIANKGSSINGNIPDQVYP
jgi:hypothetical protein